eukprot:9571669-Alexandrium_andersonii.AAC.1
MTIPHGRASAARAPTVQPRPMDPSFSRQTNEEALVPVQIQSRAVRDDGPLIGARANVKHAD